MHRPIPLHALAACLLLAFLAAPAQAGKPALKAAMDKTAYLEGDNLVITFQASPASRVLPFYFTAGGEIVLILPMHRDPQIPFQDGEKVTLPVPGEGRTFVIQPPFGAERLKIYARTHALPNIPLESAGPGLFLFKGSEAQLDKALADPDTAVTVIPFTTSPSGERGRPKKDDGPIDMTGAAGRDAGVKKVE